MEYVEDNANDVRFTKSFFEPFGTDVELVKANPCKE
jgi:hypothetical protein